MPCNDLVDVGRVRLFGLPALAATIFIPLSPTNPAHRPSFSKSLRGSEPTSARSLQSAQLPLGLLLSLVLAEDLHDRFERSAVLSRGVLGSVSNTSASKRNLLQWHIRASLCPAIKLKACNRGNCDHNLVVRRIDQCASVRGPQS